MSARLFNFKSNPFSSRVNSRFLYFTTAYQRAYAAVLNGVHQHKGLIVVSGASGSGKTTLMNRLVHEVNVDTRIVKLSGGDFKGQPGDDASGAGKRVPERSKIEFISQFLMVEADNGSNTALLFDDAHELDDVTLSELQPLLDFRDRKGRSIPVVLFGLPALNERVKQPALEKLAVNLDVECELPRLSDAEVEVYIATRLSAVGYQGELFTPEAVSRLASYSDGRPRRINMICEMALLHAGFEKAEVIEADIVDKAAIAGGLQSSEALTDGAGADTLIFADPGPLDTSISTQIFKVAPDDLLGDALMKQRADEEAEQAAAEPAAGNNTGDGLEDEPSGGEYAASDSAELEVEGEAKVEETLLAETRDVSKHDDTVDDEVEDSGVEQESAAEVVEEPESLAEPGSFDERESVEEESDPDTDETDDGEPQDESEPELPEVVAGLDPIEDEEATAIQAPPFNAEDQTIVFGTDAGAMDSSEPTLIERTGTDNAAVTVIAEHTAERTAIIEALDEERASVPPLVATQSVDIDVSSLLDTSPVTDDVAAHVEHVQPEAEKAGAEQDLDVEEVIEIGPVRESLFDRPHDYDIEDDGKVSELTSSRGFSRYETEVASGRSGSILPLGIAAGIVVMLAVGGGLFLLKDQLWPGSFSTGTEFTVGVSSTEPEIVTVEVTNEPVIPATEEPVVSVEPETEPEPESVAISTVEPALPVPVEPEPAVATEPETGLALAVEQPVVEAIPQPEIETVVPVDPEAESAARIEALLADARVQYDTFKLTTPPRDNAFSSYKEVLTIDPANEEALAGIGDIKVRYRQWAEAALAKGDKDRAEQFFRRAMLVDPEDTGLRETIVEILARDADRDADYSDVQAEAAAEAAVEEAIVVEPTTPAVTAILNENEPVATGAGGRYDQGFITAAADGDLEVMRTLIQLGADVNSRDGSGKTALMWAIDNGHTSTARFLLDRGSVVDLQANDGWTALMFAARAGQVAVLRDLISRKADIALRDRTGRSALDIGLSEGHSDVVEALRRAENDQFSSN